MKKFISIIFMLAVFATAGIADQIEKSGVIPAGRNMLSRPMTFASTDFVEANDTITITIANPQKFYQHQTFTYTMDSTSGEPAVTVKAYGRVTSNGSWVQIGSTATWDDQADNPQSIASTTPANYNWLKLEFIASSATQKVTMLTLDVRTSNTSEIAGNSGTVTFSRATSGTVILTSADNDANAALTLSAGGNGALTIGDSGSTTAIASSDWAVSTAGAMTGIGAITMDGLLTGTAGATVSGAAISLNASSNFATNIGTGTTNAAVTIGGGSNTVAVNSSDWDITTAGVVTGVGNITSDGVIKGGFQGLTPISIYDADTTLTAAHSGLFVVATHASGTTTVTIPDPSAATVGVMYYIVQTVDQNLTVTAATANGNSIVCDGVATSDNVTISTAAHKIGAGMFVYGISATKWYIGGLNPESVLTPEAAD